jgi:hypothetical protein
MGAEKQTRGREHFLAVMSHGEFSASRSVVEAIKPLESMIPPPGRGGASLQSSAAQWPAEYRTLGQFTSLPWAVSMKQRMTLRWQQTQLRESGRTLNHGDSQKSWVSTTKDTSECESMRQVLMPSQ